MIKNKHLSGQIIQTFLDGELYESERNAVEQHLATCRECQQEIKIRADWASRVKVSLSDGSFNEPEIPEFRIVQPGKRNLLPSLLKIAALVLLLLGIAQLFHKEKEIAYEPTVHDLLLWEETSTGNDANYLWHNRQIIVQIAGENGEMNFQYID